MTSARVPGDGTPWTAGIYEARRATEELDRAGVEKYDDRERTDSTDGSEGAEWSIQKRIQLLAAERDAARRALAMERDRV